jgi:hypothetical protein
LLLIAIAVVASLVVYAWVMGYIGGSTTKAGYAINIQSFAVNQTTGYLIVYVQNVGIGAVQLNPLNAVYVNSTLYSIVTWNGNPAPTNGGLITLAQGQTEALAISYSYTGGQVTIKVVTTSGAFAQVTGTPSSGSTLYQVTFGTSGGGGDSTTSPSTTQFYTAGQQVGISATAASGYTFSSWTTTGPITVADASSASTTATVNGAGTITAIFTQINFQVTFSTSGGGSGSTTSPSGTESYTAGQQVSISATAGTDHTFSDWTATGSITFADASLASTTATVNGAGTITANFVNSVASIIISPKPSTIPAGGSQSYTATAYDQYGNSLGVVTSSTTWSITSAAGGSWSSGTYTSANAGTWTVTASYSGFSDTAQLTVFGAAASFSFNPISSQTAGAAFTITITAQDANGNPVANFGGSATLTDLSGSISPVNIGPFTDGVWTSQATITKTLPTGTSDVIMATDSSLSIAGESSPFTVNSGTATSFVVSGFTNPVTAGNVGSVTVTAEDAYGNVATGYTGTVEITSSDAQAVLPSNYQFTASDAGTHVFSVTLKTAGSQSITATDTQTSSIIGSQTGITVTAGALASFAFGTISSPQTAGTPFSVTISAVDSYGNTVTSYSGTPTLSDISASISPMITSGFVDGVWTSSVTITTAYTNDVITATDSSAGITGQSVQFTVNPGALASFTFGAISSPQTAGTSFSITMTAYDSYGNVETNYAGPATLNDLSGSISPTSTGTFTNGLCTVSVIVTKATTNDVITATDPSTDNTGSSGSFTVSPAGLASFTISAISNPQIADTGFSVTITAYDQYGNVATGYIGPATLSDLSGTLSPTTATFTAGVWTSSSVTITKAYTADAITVTATSEVTVTSNSFNVVAGKLDHFAFNPIGQQIAGTAFTVTITAEDMSDNVVTNYTGSAGFTDLSGTINLKSTGVFNNGVLQASVAIAKAYTGDTITATDAVSGATGTSNAFNVVAGAPTQLVYVAGTSQSITTNTVSSVITVQLEDADGNAVTASSGVTVNLATSTTTGTFWNSSAGSTKITSVTIASGSSSASFYYSDTAAGSPVLTASSTGLTSATTTFTVSSDKLVFIEGATQTLATGQTSTAIEIAQETPTGGADYNILSTTTIQLTTSSSGGEFLSSPGGSIISSVTVGMISYESSTFYYVDSAAGTPTLTASAGGFTPGTTTFTIYAPILSSFKITATSYTVAVGTSFSITITAIDQKGNTMTSYTGTNTLYASIGSISLTTTGTFANGVWTGSVSLNTVGSITISTSGGGVTGQSSTFTVYTPVFSGFKVTASGGGNIGTQAAGTAFSITITAIDQDGNTFTGYTSNNTLTVSTGTISPTTTGTFAAGVWTGSVTLTKSGSGISISTSDGNGHSGTSNTFTVNAGALYQFSFSAIGGTQTAGTSFSVTITAQDKYGNTVTSYDSSTPLTETGGGAGGTVSPSSVTFTNGVYTGNVYVEKSGTGVTITATHGSTSSASSTFTVNPGALYQFSFSTIGTQSSGTAFTVTITAEDQYGNTVTSYSGTSTLVCSYGSATLTPTSVTFKNGVWTGSVTITVSSTQRNVYLYISGYQTKDNSNTFTV